MPYSDSFQTPPEWTMERPGKYTFALALCLILGMLSIGAAVGYGSSGKPGAVKYALLFAVLFFAISLFVLRLRMRRLVPSIDRSIFLDKERGGLLVKQSALILVSYLIMMSAIAAIFILGAIDFYQSRLAGDVTAPEAGSVVFALIGLVLVTFPVQVALGLFRRGYILLTPDGVYQRGWTFESQVPWRGFVGMKAGYHDGLRVLLFVAGNSDWKRRQIAKLWKQDKLPPSAMMDLNCNALDADPSLLYQTLQFYLDNPQARVELGTEAGLRRVKGRAFW